MTRLIDADALIEIFDKDEYERVRNEYESGYNDGLLHAEVVADDMADDMPTVDAVPVVRCKDCKHRPVYDEQKREMPPRLNIEYDEDGEPWIWDDDMTCPYLCGDSYYNQMPDDEQFCDRGEREEE